MVSWRRNATRGALRPFGSWRDSLRQVSDLVALTVPAVVMTAKRAWSITEAAYARGFDSPHRTSYRRLQLTWLDTLAMMVALLTSLVFLFWPGIIAYLEQII